MTTDWHVPTSKGFACESEVSPFCTLQMGRRKDAELQHKRSVPRLTNWRNRISMLTNSAKMKVFAPAINKAAQPDRPQITAMFVNIRRKQQAT